MRRPGSKRAGALALGGVVAALVVTGAQPAFAATGQIEQIKSSDGEVSAVFSAVDGPDGAGIDPASVTVSVNGTKVPSQAEPLSQTAASRTSAMVIDTSGSMKGPGLDAAKAAALEYLAAVPDDVEVALVSFSDKASTAIPPTTDRGALELGVAGLTAGGETALYDAVLLGLDTAGGADVGNIVVLSDGGDTISSASLKDATSAASSSDVVVDAVAFATSESTSALTDITDAGNGVLVTAAQPGDVTEAFSVKGSQVASQVLVTAEVPAEAAGSSGTVAVSGTVAGEAVSDEAVTLLSAPGVSLGPDSASSSAGLFGSTFVLALALVGIFGALFLVAWHATRKATPSQTGAPGLKKRLSVYSVGRSKEESASTAPATVEEQTTILGSSAVARNVVDYAGRVAEKRQFDTSLSSKLDAAQVKLRPGEWMVIHGAIGLAVTFLFLLIGWGGGLMSLLLWGSVGALLGFGAPYLYLSRKETKRLRAFEEALPDTLTLLAGGLTAGHSFPQAVDGVVRQGVEPVAGEFNRALSQSRLGMPLEDALEEVANRMKSKDFAWVVMAIRIQREVGGNLAEVLTQVAETLRERAYLKGQVRTLSAEGKLSAYILYAIPFLLALYLQLTRPDYLKPLYTTSGGLMAILVMVVLLIVGGFWMSRIVKVEV